MPNITFFNLSSQSLTINLGFVSLWLTFPNNPLGMGFVFLKPCWNKFLNFCDDNAVLFKTTLSEKVNKQYFDNVAENHRVNKLIEEDNKKKYLAELSFSEYQRQAKTTAIYPEQYHIVYPSLGLSGEVGEVNEKIKKVLRDNNGIFTPEKKLEISKEIGDVFWYLAALASDLGLNLGDIAQGNLDKLADRANRKVLQGSGDQR